MQLLKPLRGRFWLVKVKRGKADQVILTRTMRVTVAKGRRTPSGRPNL
jgi:hypothetical protein